VGGGATRPREEEVAVTEEGSRHCDRRGRGARGLREKTTEKKRCGGLS
jgi:hypothetical protein